MRCAGSPCRAAARLRQALVALAGTLALGSAAQAQTVLPARDDARIGAPGRAGVGLLAPASFVLHPCAQIEAHPLLFLLAPHVALKVAHWRRDDWHVSGQYGLALPWPAQKLLQGTLFPSFKRGGGQIGFTVVPSAGALASHATPLRVLTVKLDAAIGIPLSSSDLRPLEAPAPLELLFAPVLARYRIHAGLLWDGVLSARWRGRLYGDVFLTGVDPDREARASDHLTFRAGLGADAVLTDRLRLALDVMVWNNNQFAVDGNGRRVRSTDVLPIVDLLWAW